MWYLLHMITWIIGGRRYYPRPRFTSPNSINCFYSIEQGIVVDLFSPNSLSWNITSTISSLGGRLAGLGTISNSPITTNSISWKSQQYTMFTLVRGGILPARRLIFGVFRKKRDNLLVERDIFCHFRGIVLCNAKHLQFHWKLMELGEVNLGLG